MVRFASTREVLAIEEQRLRALMWLHVIDVLGKPLEPFGQAVDAPGLLSKDVFSQTLPRHALVEAVSVAPVPLVACRLLMHDTLAAIDDRPTARRSAETLGRNGHRSDFLTPRTGGHGH
jgi:hypothetical protein